MSDQKLIGQNYTPLDLVAKVTGRAKYAEEYRADGMLFTKLLLSPMPHARVAGIDTRAALAMPGVLEIEDRVPAAVRDELTARGHKLRVIGAYSMSTGVVAVGVDPKTGALRGGADVRRERYLFGW